jgi:hypothetical protein
MVKLNKTYIKIRDINNDLEYDKDSHNYINIIQDSRIKNKVNKLISEGELLMKKNSKVNISNNLNDNGLYFSLNKSGEKYSN